MELNAVSEAKLADELLGLYLSLFKKKYTQDAILDGETDRLAFTWLASKFPRPKAMALVEAYFCITDRFVAEKMYPPKLIKTSINQINALSKRFETHSDNGPTQLVLKIPLSCDSCFKTYQWVGTDKDLGKARVCSDCMAEKKQKKAEMGFRQATSKPLLKEFPEEP